MSQALSLIKEKIKIRDIPDCLLWIDPPNTETPTIDASNLISNMGDLSGNGHSFSQATGSLQPLYGNDLNHRPSMTFDGLNDILANSSLAFDWNNNGFTVFAVAKDNASVNEFRGIIGNRFGAGAANWWTLGFHKDNGSIGIEIGGGVALNALASFESKGKGAHLYTGYSDASNLTIELDGVKKDSVSTGANNLGGVTNELRIGSWFIAPQIWDGSIGPIIIFGHRLTDYERNTVNSYLIKLTGIQT